MTIRNFEFLLQPRSVALIGASTRPGSVGLITARNLLAGGFAGPIWLVNPKHSDIEGHACYPSVAALPAAPDLAVIVTPPATLPHSSPSSGPEGRAPRSSSPRAFATSCRQAMLEAARPHLLRIQGPNCLGLMLPGIGLNASFSHQPPLAGDLAFLSQSGALITAIIDWARGAQHRLLARRLAGRHGGRRLRRPARLSRRRRASRAILLYMESVTHAPKFMSAARRAARAKPVIVVKAGRSAAGAKAALSHTGALAGADVGLRSRVPARRRAARARARRSLQRRRDPGAASAPRRRPARHPDQRRRRRRAGGRPARRPRRPARRASPRRRDRRSMPSCRRPGRTAIRSTSSAMPTRRDTRAPSRCCSRDDGTDAILVMNCPTALASSTAVAEEIVTALQRRADGRRAAQAGACRLARRRGEPRCPQAVRRQGHRELRHAGRGHRRVHAARATTRARRKS